MITNALAQSVPGGVMTVGRPLTRLQASTDINVSSGRGAYGGEMPILAGIRVAGRDSASSTSETPQGGQNGSTGLKSAQTVADMVRERCNRVARHWSDSDPHIEELHAVCVLVDGLQARLTVAEGLIDESRPVVAWASKAQATLIECGKWFADDHFCADYPLRHKIEALLAEVAIEPTPDPISPAIADVAAERRRQIEAKGWTPEHDDEHDRDNALSRAAACYALAGLGANGPFWVNRLQVPQQVWPYRWEWKPKDRRFNLVRAAALLVAEIERLDRAEVRS